MPIGRFLSAYIEVLYEGVSAECKATDQDECAIESACLLAYSLFPTDDGSFNLLSTLLCSILYKATPVVSSHAKSVSRSIPSDHPRHH